MQRHEEAFFFVPLRLIVQGNRPERYDAYGMGSDHFPVEALKTYICPSIVT